MPTPSLRNVWYSLALATTLTVGALFAWILTSGWAYTVVSQVFTQPRSANRLVVATNGEPLLQSVQSNVTVLHTLDGKPVDNQRVEQFYGSLPSDPRGENEAARWAPFRWDMHIFSFVDPTGMPVYWYLIQGADDPRRAYFEAYDGKTNERLGYLATGGFRRDFPPLEEQLKVSPLAGYFGRLAGTFFGGAQVPYNYHRDQGGKIFIDGADVLYRVDLAKREVSAVPTDGPVTSIANVEQPIEIDAEVGPVSKRRIAVRLADRIELWTDQGQPLRTLPLPADTTDRALQVFLTPTDHAVLVAGVDGSHPEADIYRFSSEGIIEGRQQVRLPADATITGSDVPWYLCGALPAPAVVASMLVSFLPYTLVVGGVYDTFSSAFAAQLSAALPALGLLCLVSAAFAVLAYRRQRRYGEPGAGIWAVFVLLAGPAGYVGYLLHRVWPARAACAACGKPTPMYLRGCVVCAAERPLPAASGIEIFA